MDSRKIIFFMTGMTLLLSSLALAGSITYEYDSFSQLKKATYADGTVIAYAYDNIGNRVSMVVTVPDVDGDGMSDSWEMHYFGNLDRDGGGDYDVDGATDLDEYLSGADPLAGSGTAGGDSPPQADSGDPALARRSSPETSGTASCSTAAPGSTREKTAAESFARNKASRRQGDQSADAGGGGGDEPSGAFQDVDAAFVVAVESAAGEAFEGFHVLAFTDEGEDTGLQSMTGGDGVAVFDPADFDGGAYLFRVDYLSGQFWSEPVQVVAGGNIRVIIEEAEVEVSILGEPAGGIRVFLHDADGVYLDRYAETGEAGRAAFVLPVGVSFRFSAELPEGRYWSDRVTVRADGAGPVEIWTGEEGFTVTFIGDRSGKLYPGAAR